MSQNRNAMKNWIIVLLALTCVCLIGLLLTRKPSNTEPIQSTETKAGPSLWTCSMHPQIQLPDPGLCPICAMDLIPVSEGEDDTGPWELKLSPHAQKLASIQVTPVIRKKIAREINMVGKVDYDEKRVGDISARVAGRIDRLFVDFTGISVKKGDHMVEVYSPELITAQEELRQALTTYEKGPESLKPASLRRANAARRKLELLGLTKQQVSSVEGKKTPEMHSLIRSPLSGVVIKKHLNEGAYVKTGAPIYTIADLSRVWVVLEAYESDLRWLRFGQEVTIEVAAFPEEPLQARIVFIDTSLNPKTRTVQVRLDMPNPGGRLKPDMFVRAKAFASLTRTGKLMDPSLAGKWISPMHPEIVKDNPGSCDVCGMDLVKAESLGFETANDQDAPLLIPRFAPLMTGERAVVYVTVPGKPGHFEGRTVVLGPESGEYFVVKEGLEEGEQVVVNGAFKIDSEMQIRAKHSMMYLPETKQASKQQPIPTFPITFVNRLGSLYEPYFQIQSHLGDDQFEKALQTTTALTKALQAIDGDRLEPEQLVYWQQVERSLAQTLTLAQTSESIGDLRKAFEPLSGQVLYLMNQIGLPEDLTVYRFHCPMAFENTGADWLQIESVLKNPYFGASMLRCGSQLESFDSKSLKTKQDLQP